MTTSYLFLLTLFSFIWNEMYKDLMQCPFYDLQHQTGKVTQRQMAEQVTNNWEPPPMCLSFQQSDREPTQSNAIGRGRGDLLQAAHFSFITHWRVTMSEREADLILTPYIIHSAPLLDPLLWVLRFFCSFYRNKKKNSAWNPTWMEKSNNWSLWQI